jgi:hypothetical protein
MLLNGILKKTLECKNSGITNQIFRLALFPMLETLRSLRRLVRMTFTNCAAGLAHQFTGKNIIMHMINQL